MLEVIATNVEDALAIEAGGGDRIELVSAMSEGGLTPSYAMVEQVIQRVSIPVNVMVRPHSHSFEYSNACLDVMKRDIEIFQQLEVNAFVLGLLKDGRVNFTGLEKLLKDISCQVTFHRAIDETKVIYEDYKALLKQEKITQVLTSGGPGKAEENLDVLDSLYALEPHKLLIGSGISQENIKMFKNRYKNINLHIGSAVRVGNAFNQEINIDKVKKNVELYYHKA